MPIPESFAVNLHRRRPPHITSRRLPPVPRMSPLDRLDARTKQMRDDAGIVEAGAVLTPRAVWADVCSCSGRRWRGALSVARAGSSQVHAVPRRCSNMPKVCTAARRAERLGTARHSSGASRIPQVDLSANDVRGASTNAEAIHRCTVQKRRTARIP